MSYLWIYTSIYMYQIRVSRLLLLSLSLSQLMIELSATAIEENLLRSKQMVEQELSNTIRKKVLPLQCDRDQTNCLTKKTSAAIALTSRINLAPSELTYFLGNHFHTFVSSFSMNNHFNQFSSVHLIVFNVFMCLPSFRLLALILLIPSCSSSETCKQ